MISAIDGSSKDKSDMFRIKLWDMANEDVVYDNQFGTEDNSDPTTEIGGGAIVVHEGKDKNSSRSANNVDSKDDYTGELIFWPNPSNSFFNLKFNTDNMVLITINVFDINSRLVHQKTGITTDTYQFGELLKSGIYFVKLDIGDKKQLLKLVKY